MPEGYDAARVGNWLVGCPNVEPADWMTSTAAGTQSFPQLPGFSRTPLSFPFTQGAGWVAATPSRRHHSTALVSGT